MAEMIRLFTVVSPARSGTKWYSRLFTTERSFCFHELTSLYRPYPINIVGDSARGESHLHHGRDFELAQRRTLLDAFPQYFTRLWDEARDGRVFVGNSDWFAARFAPGLWLLWPDMRFLFSFRNGINVVNSWFVWEEHVPRSVLRWWDAEYSTSNYFEQCCHVWAEEAETLRRHHQWLDSRHAACAETRLEHMTTNRGELRRVWDWLFDDSDAGADQAETLMGTPVNARINSGGIVGWEQIWERWTDEHKRHFIRICGATQTALEYELPGD